MVQQWVINLLELYDVLTVSDDYQRKLKESHERSGSLRSGEGTESEILEKIRKLDERKQLTKMLESKEFSNDPVVN